jgi:hypothetical protein
MKSKMRSVTSITSTRVCQMMEMEPYYGVFIEVTALCTNKDHHQSVSTSSSPSQAHALSLSRMRRLAPSPALRFRKGRLHRLSRKAPLPQVDLRGVYYAHAGSRAADRPGLLLL